MAPFERPDPQQTVWIENLGYSLPDPWQAPDWAHEWGITIDQDVGEFYYDYIYRPAFDFTQSVGDFLESVYGFPDEGPAAKYCPAGTPPNQVCTRPHLRTFYDRPNYCPLWKQLLFIVNCDPPRRLHPSDEKHNDDRELEKKLLGKDKSRPKMGPGIHGRADVNGTWPAGKPWPYKYNLESEELLDQHEIDKKLGSKKRPNLSPKPPRNIKQRGIMYNFDPDESRYPRGYTIIDKDTGFPLESNKYCSKADQFFRPAKMCKNPAAAGMHTEHYAYQAPHRSAQDTIAIAIIIGFVVVSGIIGLLLIRNKHRRRASQLRNANENSNPDPFIDPVPAPQPQPSYFQHIRNAWNSRHSLRGSAHTQSLPLQNLEHEQHYQYPNHYQYPSQPQPQPNYINNTTSPPRPPPHTRPSQKSNTNITTTTTHTSSSSSSAPISPPYYDPSPIATYFTVADEQQRHGERERNGVQTPPPVYGARQFEDPFVIGDVGGQRSGASE